MSGELVRMETSSPLRVLLMVDDLSIGGAERSVAGLATALTGRGHEVVVACAADGPLRDDIEASGVGVRILGGRHVKWRLSPVLALRLLALLKERRFDLVHAHVHAAVSAALVAGAAASVPVVVTEHGMAAWRGRWVRWYTRQLYQRCAAFIAVSEGVRERLRTVDRVRPERVVTIPNAAIPAPRKTETDAGGALEALPRPLVGIVARLRPEKGPQVFVEAVANVARRHPTASFVLVGDGPLRGPLTDRVRELGLQGRVHFLGDRLDGPSLIGELDVLCVPSFDEAAPLVVLEAMAAGVPVVASDLAGVRNQTGGPEAAMLVPPGDSTALSTALDQLLSRPDERRRLSAAGLRRSIDGLSYEGAVARVEAIYRQVVLAATNSRGRKSMGSRTPR